jgi:repressor LexA
VATATGIYPSTFSDWKSGRSNPGVEKLAKIAKFFGVPMEYFLENEDTE